MKNLLNTTVHRRINSISKTQPVAAAWSAQAVIYFIMLITTFLFTACKKYNANEPNEEEQTMSTKANVASPAFLNTSGISGQTIGELMQVRAATMKYQDTASAVADGYVNLDLKLPNMGFHFLKKELAEDGKFDLRKPEFLVYNPNANGKFELVAVEYGVPIDPNNPFTPPAGFTGDADEWDRNTLNSGLWTLHAWVWKFNPDGVFEMMNPDVIVP